MLAGQWQHGNSGGPLRVPACCELPPPEKPQIGDKRSEAATCSEQTQHCTRQPARAHDGSSDGPFRQGLDLNLPDTIETTQAVILQNSLGKSQICLPAGPGRSKIDRQEQVLQDVAWFPTLPLAWRLAAPLIWSLRSNFMEPELVAQALTAPASACCFPFSGTQMLPEKKCGKHATSPIKTWQQSCVMSVSCTLGPVTQCSWGGTKSHCALVCPQPCFQHECPGRNPSS